MMPDSDPRDRFVYPCLTLMIDSFSCTFLCQRLNSLQFYLEILPLNTPLIQVSHLVLTSFADALVTSLVTKLRDAHITGSEQQGQNTRVRTVFLTLAKILDLLVFFNQVCKKPFSTLHILKNLVPRLN